MFKYIGKVMPNLNSWLNLFIIKKIVSNIIIMLYIISMYQQYKFYYVVLIFKKILQYVCLNLVEV